MMLLRVVVVLRFVLRPRRRPPRLPDRPPSEDRPLLLVVEDMSELRQLFFVVVNWFVFNWLCSSGVRWRMLYGDRQVSVPV